MHSIRLKLTIFVLAAGILTDSVAQSKDTIEVKKLLEVVETKSFPAFYRLYHSMEYALADSSADTRNGNIIYLTVKKDILPFTHSTLGIVINKKDEVISLRFSTYNKQTYNNMKSQLRKTGFKSSGLSKDDFDASVLESEDFTKGIYVISTSAEKNKDGNVFYSFTCFIDRM